MIALTGQMPQDATGALVSDDPLTQCRQVFANINTGLAAVGAGPQNVLRLDVWLLDLAADLGSLRTAYHEWTGPEDPPAVAAPGGRPLPAGSTHPGQHPRRDLGPSCHLLFRDGERAATLAAVGGARAALPRRLELAQPGVAALYPCPGGRQRRVRRAGGAVAHRGHLLVLVQGGDEPRARAWAMIVRTIDSGYGSRSAPAPLLPGRRSRTPFRPGSRAPLHLPAIAEQPDPQARAALGTDLFVRDSRQVELTTAGRALLEEAPLALAALDRAAERARLAGEGSAGTVRLGYAPTAGFETLGAILAAVEHDSPNVTVIASELFSAEIPGRVLAGEFDVGVALHPEPMRGVRSEPLRMEPHVVLVSQHHRLADMDPISLASLENETLLLFPRELAPACYDRVIAACEQSGFEPRIVTFADPPPQAMVARLQAAREVGLPPASLAFRAAGAESGLIARRIVQPGILAEWSILRADREQSTAVTGFLASARRCADQNDWLLARDDTTNYVWKQS